MTSQREPHQKTQDDGYSNTDDKPHKGPIQSSEPQPGPKHEKQVQGSEQPLKEKQTSSVPDSAPATPEKQLPESKEFE